MEMCGGVRCAQCGETDIDVLCFDHIHDDGAEERRQRSGGKSMAYRIASGRRSPEGLQVLCANCNMRKQTARIRTRALSVLDNITATVVE